MRKDEADYFTRAEITIGENKYELFHTAGNGLQEYVDEWLSGITETKEATMESLAAFITDKGKHLAQTTLPVFQITRELLNDLKRLYRRHASNPQGWFLYRGRKWNVRYVYFLLQHYDKS